MSGGCIFYGHFDGSRLERVQAQRRVPVAHNVWYPLRLGHRFDLYGTHQAVACCGQQLEFVVRTALAQGGQAFPVVPFRKQVLEIDRPTAVGSYQALIAGGFQDGASVGFGDAPIAQGQEGALGVLDIAALEGDLCS